jgi:hypothetical protein
MAPSRMVPKLRLRRPASHVCVSEGRPIITYQ